MESSLEEDLFVFLWTCQLLLHWRDILLSKKWYSISWLIFLSSIRSWRARELELHSSLRLDCVFHFHIVYLRIERPILAERDTSNWRSGRVDFLFWNINLHSLDLSLHSETHLLLKLSWHFTSDLLHSEVFTGINELILFLQTRQVIIVNRT